MIKSIRVKNFKSHENTSVKFHKGVNVIVGTSDNGKSALLKALVFTITNKPAGHSFIRHGTDLSKVTVNLGNEIIVHGKSKSKNYYMIKSKDEETSTYTAFGQGVPEDIKKSFAIDSINMQGQFDPPFLLSSNPGEVASHFNDIANLQDIGISISNINKAKNKISSDISHYEKSLITAQETYDEYDYLEKLEIEIEMMEEMQKKVAVDSSKIKSLSKLVSDHNKTSKSVKAFSQILTAKNKLNNIEDLVKKLNLFQQRKTKLSSIVNNLKNLYNQQKVLNSKLKAEKPLQKINQMTEYKKEMDEKIEKLETLVKKIKSVKKDKTSIIEELTSLEAKFAFRFPDVCPLCDQPVKDHTHED